MDRETHTLVETLANAWHIVAGVSILAMGLMRLVWARITRDLVTRSELHECRSDVRAVDESILVELRQHAKENNEKHEQIMKAQGEQFATLMKEIIKLHDK